MTDWIVGCIRRNAMKARAKDTVGRQHKGHFGRQRLDVLAKGICAARSTACVGTLGSGDRPLVEIDFAHARRGEQLDLDGANGDSGRHCYIPSPVRIAPSTPRASAQKRARRAAEAHTSSSAASGSRVLDALDMSERRWLLQARICGVLLMIFPTALFLRRLMDQIVAMPNLACLKRRNPAKSLSSSPQDIRGMSARKTSTPRRENHRRENHRKVSSVAADSASPF
ncbi:hypothetical protein HYPSUDRAFT_71055 [Hypholoma sublateritium FD-334 SS-4]|uniref:Uncharacterized protein n=1 Tax=Hypholoma sublateritium (strain FD-334 SS-4) TaxID=945553 RepID=A0A0D2NCQ9_HYPSF|nr:hypothetical protein HYPSUDRAFT_71055 [Hypholoma sublateritium FD-334 SS-4]